jgi:hypothetical protein
MVKNFNFGESFNGMVYVPENWIGNKKYVGRLKMIEETNKKSGRWFERDNKVSDVMVINGKNYFGFKIYDWNIEIVNKGEIRVFNINDFGKCMFVKENGVNNMREYWNKYNDWVFVIYSEGLNNIGYKIG